MLCELVTWSDILLKRKEMVPGYTLQHITKGFRLDKNCLISMEGRL
jgi:hypothetical protein